MAQGNVVGREVQPANINLKFVTVLVSYSGEVWVKSWMATLNVLGEKPGALLINNTKTFDASCSAERSTRSTR